MTSILIGTPCYNGLVTVEYMASMLGLQQELTRQGVGFSWETTVSMSLIPIARNFIVSKLLANPEFTHLLFIDADIGFDPRLVARFLGFNKDVVAGIYPIKNLNLEAIRQLPPAAPVAATMNYAVTVCAGEQPTQDGFVRAEYAATGFMLIRRGVLERMAAHYAELKYGDSFTHTGVDKAAHEQHLYALFDTSLDADKKIYLPEDYTFCRRWRALGGEIWVDVFSKFTHVGTFPFEGDFSVFVQRG